MYQSSFAAVLSRKIFKMFFREKKKKKSLKNISPLYGYSTTKANGCQQALREQNNRKIQRCLYARYRLELIENPAVQENCQKRFFKMASEEETPKDAGQVQYLVISNIIKIKSSSQIGLISSICLPMFNFGFSTVGLLPLKTFVTKICSLFMYLQTAITIYILMFSCSGAVSAVHQ